MGRTTARIAPDLTGDGASGHMPSVLIVIQDSVRRDLLAVLLKQQNLRVAATDSLAAAMAMLAYQTFDAVFMEARGHGLEPAAAIQEIRARAIAPPPRLVLLADQDDLDAQATARASAVAGILACPFSLAALRPFVDLLRPVN